MGYTSQGDVLQGIPLVDELADPPRVVHRLPHLLSHGHRLEQPVPDDRIQGRELSIGDIEVSAHPLQVFTNLSGPKQRSPVSHRKMHVG